MEEMRALIDGYDCGTRYADDHVGLLLSALEDAGVAEETAIIISSDHATCRIPLIVKWPGGQAGHRDSGLHYNIDLAPTYSAVLGGERKPQWDGESFVEAITAGSECGRDELILSQNSHDLQRSVRWGNWIYIRTYHDGYHLWPREMLFDLDADPYEQTDVAETNPAVCHAGAHRLMNWHDEMMLTMPFGHFVDPLWRIYQEGGPFHTRGHLGDYLTRLTESGRAEGARMLEERHRNEFDLQGLCGP